MSAALATQQSPYFEPRRLVAAAAIILILAPVFAKCGGSTPSGGGGGYRHTVESDEAQLRQHGIRRDLSAWEKNMRDQAKRDKR